MPRTDPVLIFDLDGTILRINSFPIWALMLLLGRAPHLPWPERLALSVRVQRLLMRRRLHGVPHGVLMRELQAVWRDAVASDAEQRMAARLSARLLRLVRPVLRPVLDQLGDEQVDAVLATAAAAEYAEPLGAELGFRTVLATPALREDAKPCHNIGIRKRDAVLGWLQARGWECRPRIFFNDALSDLPLMRECDAVCWFGSDRALRRARGAAPAVRFVPCRKLRPDEMRTVLAHISHSLSVVQLAAKAVDAAAGAAGIRIVS